MTTNRTILALLLMTAMLSCQSEEQRKDEETRENLRNLIGLVEETQQGHLDALRELIELHEKLKLSFFGTKPPAEKAREDLNRAEESYSNGWQDDFRERIERASGEELLRVAFELRRLEAKASIGKAFKESAVQSIRRRQSIPPKDRMP